VAAPGVVAGLIPWLLTGWRFAGSWPLAVRGMGFAIAASATVVLVSAFTQFVVEGIGTPAPVAPTQHLVVKGLYRYVRNPMYVAVVVAIMGQALLFGQPGLLIYGAIVGAAMWTFVVGYEEPYLAARYGAEYEAYRRAVPGWWPRFRAG
jgi:protein-S-isoprenylcysteine O-methyltransferase Ste14